MGDAQLPGTLERVAESAVLAFTLALAILTGLVFGIIPALAITRGNAAAFLKDDSRSGTASQSTGAVRTVLVVAETMFAVMLLIGAGLLLKSFARLQSVNPGFTAENVLTAQIALPASRYPDAAAYRAFWARLLEQRARDAGRRRSPASTTNVPFNGNVSSGSYSIVGRAQGPGEAAAARPPGSRRRRTTSRRCTSRCSQGGCSTTATPSTPHRVCIVDEYLAKKYFPTGRSPSASRSSAAARRTRRSRSSASSARSTASISASR